MSTHTAALHALVTLSTILVLVGCDDVEVADVEHAAPDPCASAHPVGVSLDLAEAARRLGVVDLPAHLAAPGEPASESAARTSEPASESATPDLRAAAGPDTATLLPPLYYTGVFQQRTLYRSPIRIIRLCDSDGTDCSNATRAAVQAALDSADALHYRSDSKLRFRIDPLSDFAGHLDSDALNNECKPLAGLGGLPGDLDGDGDNDGDDAAIACPTVWDPGLATTIGELIEAAGSIPVYSRGGVAAVNWTGQMWQARPHGGGSSSCEGHSVNMPAGFGELNLMAHELGHYFCLPHTFKTEPRTAGEARAQILARVLAGLDTPSQEQEILEALYDGDRNTTYGGAFAYVNGYPLHDTPPDARGSLVNDVYGDGAKCQLGDRSVDLEVTFPAPWSVTRDYLIDPDRRNVMSYFKDCFGEFHYISPDQRARAHAVALNHRASVSDVVVVDGWENTADVAIPARPDFGAGPLNWAASYLETAGGAGAPARVRVHVDIKHDEGGLHLKLVAPGGLEFALQGPAQNDGKVTGDVKTIFYVPGAGLTKSGVWALKVAAEHAQFDAGDYRIDDWRIEFE